MHCATYAFDISHGLASRQAVRYFCNLALGISINQ
jgi:hypothetical protein